MTDKLVSLNPLRPSQFLSYWNCICSHALKMFVSGTVSTQTLVGVVFVPDLPCAYCQIYQQNKLYASHCGGSLSLTSFAWVSATRAKHLSDELPEQCSLHTLL